MRLRCRNEERKLQLVSVYGADTGSVANSSFFKNENWNKLVTIPVKLP